MDGGYLVSGRWPYSSGSFAADWATLGIGLDVPEGGDPRALALIPAEAWSIEPTWFMSGMRGSGSDTIVVDEHFVPDHRIQGFGDMVERRYGTSFTTREPNSAMAFIPVAALILAAPLLGLARHALEITLANVPEERRVQAYRQAQCSLEPPDRSRGVRDEFDLAELLMRVRRATSARQRRRDPRPAPPRSRPSGHGRDRRARAARDQPPHDRERGVLVRRRQRASRVWRDAEVAARHALVCPARWQAPLTIHV